MGTLMLKGLIMFHQCGLCSTLEQRLRLSLLVDLLQEIFPWLPSVFHSPQKPSFPNYNLTVHKTTLYLISYFTYIILAI